MRTSAARRWTRLVTRFFAADYGLNRLRFATGAVATLVLAVLALALLGLSTSAVAIGATAGISASTAPPPGTARLRGVQLALFVPVMAAAAALSALTGPYPMGHSAVLVAVMFLGVWVRRFPPLGTGAGIGGFMVFFFTSFLGATPADIPVLGLAVLVGVGTAAVTVLGLLHDTPVRALARTVRSIHGQAVALVDDLEELVARGDRLPPHTGLPPVLAGPAGRIHETALQIGDTGEQLGLAGGWRRALVTAELSLDRLCRATVRALDAGMDAGTRRLVRDELRDLRRFLEQEPELARHTDTREVLRRIARHGLPGGPAVLPASSADHAELVRRAVWEVVLAVTEVARTATDPTTGSAGGAEPDTTGPGDGGPGDGGPRDGGLSDAPGPPGVRRWIERIAPATRSGLQCALGGALALAGGHLLPGRTWHWAVFSSFLVFINITSRGELMVKGWRRVVGSVAGLVIATILAAAVVDLPILNVVIMLVCVFLAFYTLRVSSTVMTFFVTVMAGMLYDATDTFSVALMLSRTVETMIGALAAALAATVLFPTRTRATALGALHGFLTALHDRLVDAEAVLVADDRTPGRATTRAVAGAVREVRAALDPLTHPLSRSRLRPGSALLMLTLTEEMALAADHLATAAEPGALAGLPEAARTLRRLIDNTTALRAATATAGAVADLFSAPELGPIVDLGPGRVGGGDLDRVRLRRVVTALDRLDLMLLGMAEPLGGSVAVVEPDGSGTGPTAVDRGGAQVPAADGRS